MSSRYRIRHLTTYAYGEAVTLSHNLAHLALRDWPGQRVRSQRLDIDPAPVEVRRRLDYFGNPVDAFVITAPHGRLVVASHAEVEIDPPAIPDPAATPSWDDAAVQGGGDTAEAWEHRYDSAHVPSMVELHRYAEADFAPGRPVLEAALALTQRIHREFAYDTQATSIATPVFDVLEMRRGVCQDFAQVLIGCLRSRGVPARYISGYLETIPPQGRERLVGADATHAWAQAWCGPAAGWIDLDPTNACIPAERHIRVALGRDFADVSPLKGMVLGGGRADVQVGVDVERC
jgi:transglutaminase-like putative cysteine protease